MKHEKGFAAIGLVVFLGILYILLFSCGRSGYGYMGYHGFRRGPSFWYWGGPRVYHEPNIRTGSVGNQGRRGGGFGSGK